MASSCVERKGIMNLFFFFFYLCFFLSLESGDDMIFMEVILLKLFHLSQPPSSSSPSESWFHLQTFVTFTLTSLYALMLQFSKILISFSVPCFYLFTYLHSLFELFCMICHCIVSQLLLLSLCRSSVRYCCWIALYQRTIKANHVCNLPTR